MAKRKESEQERLEPSGLRREMRRLDLMDLFRQEKDYFYRTQQSLRNDWRAVETVLHRDVCESATFVTFEECRSAANDPSAHWYLRQDDNGGLLDRLRRYVSGVESYLARRRLCFKGHPAEWALQDTHDFITGVDQFSIEVIAEQFFTGVERDATFRLSIAPGGAFIARLEEDPKGGRALQYVAAEELNPTPGASFAEFEQFKQLAHAQVDRWIDEVRASWVAALGEKKLVARRRHAAKQPVAEREAKYNQMLFDYLNGDTDIAREDKEQLRKVCKSIELTLPSAR